MFYGLADALQAEVAAEDDEGFKEGGRVFAAADGDANGLEGLPGLEAEGGGGGSQSFVERVVVECGVGQNFVRGL